MAPGAINRVVLMDEDPELASTLGPEEREAARRALLVPAHWVEIGAWSFADVAQEPTLGALILEGVFTVNVVLGDRIASHLAGPGDVLHAAAPPDPFVPAAVEHVVSQRARIAVLDQRFIAGLRRWPALLIALNERQRLHERRLAVHAAIGKQRRVHDRVLGLLWHLAERWGRVTAEGVVVSLALTHEAIGRLAGAERPTVSLALKELADAGELSRRADGAFVLARESRGLQALSATAIPQARALRLVEPAGADAEAREPVSPRTPPALLDITELRRRLAVLNEDLAEHARAVDDLLADSQTRAKRPSGRRQRPESDRDDRTG